jgi:hypothetical protein
MKPASPKSALIHGDHRTRRVTISGRIRLNPDPSRDWPPLGKDGLITAEKFNWGDTMAGSALLAHALLLHFTDEKFARAHYQDFKRDIIAGFDTDQDFDFPVHRVMVWIKHTRRDEQELPIMYETIKQPDFMLDDENSYKELG